MIKNTLLLIVLVFTLFNIQAQNTWIYSGNGIPSNYQVKDFAAKNQHEIYAVGDTTIFRTVDAGENWSPITTNGLQNHSDGYWSVAIAGNKLFLSAANNDSLATAVYSSTDGINWNLSNYGLPKYFWIWDFIVASDDTLYAVGAKIFPGVARIYKSTDAGNTWNYVPINGIDTSAPFTAGAKVGEKIFVVCSNSDRIYSSIDDTNWVASDFGTPSNFLTYSLVVGEDAEVYAMGSAADSATIYKSMDGGDNWNLFYTSGKGNYDFSHLAGCATGSAIYACITDTIFYSPPINSYSIFKLPLGKVSGFVYHDINQNCQHDLNETKLANRTVTIQPGNIVSQTNSVGVWLLDSLPAGNYTITIDTSNNWLPTCPVAQSFTVVHPDSITIVPSIGVLSSSPCPVPDVSIHAPFLRPGFSNQKIYVEACNDIMGSDILNSAYVIVVLDTSITVQSASVNYTALGNNKFRVDVDTLFVGQCIDFWLDCHVSANTPLGKTLCMSATLHPVDPCFLDTVAALFPAGISPCLTSYDDSHLEVQSYCNNDSIFFIISNTGNGNMSCHSQTRTFIDTVLTFTDSILLNAGEADTLFYSADGRTWRLETDQHPLHPGNSNPSTTIERCGNVNNWTPRLVNVMPQNDADPQVDIYCGVVTGSYDPNDKTGFPLGVDPVYHFIEQNQEIEYLIRFQNTGTDTAFTVVVRDTLPEVLDIFSLKSGVSSHDYSFKMYGPRVLEWTFKNINLPDSTSDLAGSNGFIKFKVKQNKDLPIGTFIDNSASIYFDFNSPIITNNYWHTIGLPQEMNISDQGIIQSAICDSFSFNGYTYYQPGNYYQAVNNNGTDSLYIIDLYTVDTSVTVSLPTLTANVAEASYQWVDCDNNYSPIVGENSQSFTPAVNGNYAVLVTESGCTDTSACYTVKGIGIDNRNLAQYINIYPNPTEGRFTIDLGSSYDNITLTITNALGQVILKNKYSSAYQLDIMIDGDAGFYFVEVLDENGRTANLKILKH